MDFDSIKAKTALLVEVEEMKRKNQQAPIPRRHRDPSTELQNWEAFVKKFGAKRKKHKKMTFTTTISGNAHCCKTPFKQLKPIQLRDMHVPKVHSGRYLVCKVVGAPCAEVGVHVLVQDLNGDVEHVEIFNYSYDITDTKWIKDGAILIIKEPCLKFGLNNEVALLRIDSPSDLIFVDPTDFDYLESVGAKQWHIEATTDSDTIREEGNKHFLAKDYETATFLYNRAIRYAPDTAVLYLNRASSQLRSGHFEGAYESAKLALDKGGDREKALFRMGLAAYGMRDWSSAVDHFKTTCKEFPKNADAKAELSKAKTRLKESQTGKYDWKSMHQANKHWRQELDVADYIGPIEVADVPGRSKGMIASMDIPKGTLLMVSKPFSTGYKEDIAVNLMCANSIINIVNHESTKQLVIRTIENLRKNPSIAKELYKLYAGDLPRNKNIPNDVIDTGRIEHICVSNCFVIEDLNEWDPDELLRKSACGLYLAPSFFNHECMASAIRSKFGEIIMFHATRDLKKGEEITFAYVAVTKSYQERTDMLRKWGFTCECRLCKLDAKDNNCDERFEILRQFREILELQQESQKKIAAQGRKMLEQMRKLYGNRTEVQIDLVQMLEAVGVAHLEAGDIEAAIKYWNEMVSLVDEELELAVELPTNLLQLAIFYLRVGKHNKKVTELVKKAYKMSVCKDVEHFKIAYSETNKIPQLDSILSRV